MLELTLEIHGNFEIWNGRRVTHDLHLPDYKRDVCVSMRKRIEHWFEREICSVFNRETYEIQVLHDR